MCLFGVISLVDLEKPIAYFAPQSSATYRAIAR